MYNNETVLKYKGVYSVDKFEGDGEIRFLVIATTYETALIIYEYSSNEEYAKKVSINIPKLCINDMIFNMKKIQSVNKSWLNMKKPKYITVLNNNEFNKIKNIINDYIDDKIVYKKESGWVYKDKYLKNDFITINDDIEIDKKIHTENRFKYDLLRYDYNYDDNNGKIKITKNNHIKRFYKNKDISYFRKFSDEELIKIISMTIPSIIELFKVPTLSQARRIKKNALNIVYGAELCGKTNNIQHNNIEREYKNIGENIITDFLDNKIILDNEQIIDMYGTNNNILSKKYHCSINKILEFKMFIKSNYLSKDINWLTKINESNINNDIDRYIYDISERLDNVWKSTYEYQIDILFNNIPMPTTIQDDLVKPFIILIKSRFSNPHNLSYTDITSDQLESLISGDISCISKEFMVSKKEATRLKRNYISNCSKKK